MRALEIADATGPLATYARKLRRRPLIVTRRGRPMMALVPLENVDLETLSLSSNPDFIALIESSRARHPAGTGIPLEVVRQRLGLDRPRRAKKAGRSRRSSSPKRRVARR
jgi:hypothetical protein